MDSDHIEGHYNRNALKAVVLDADRICCQCEGGDGEGGGAQASPRHPGLL